MPTVDIIDGIKILIYSGDHRPAHFHAVYNEYEVVIEIESGKFMQVICLINSLRKFLIGF